MLATLPATVVRELLQFVIQTTPVDVVPGRRLRSGLPAVGQLTATTQDTPRVTAQRAHVQPLRIAVRIGVG